MHLFIECPIAKIESANSPWPIRFFKKHFKYQIKIVLHSKAKLKMSREEETRFILYAVKAVLVVTHSVLCLFNFVFVN